MYVRRRKKKRKKNHMKEKNNKAKGVKKIQDLMQRISI